MRKMSTEEVRSQWSYSRDPGPEHRTTQEWWQIRDEARAEFDKWLDEVKADAWADGWSEGFGNARDEFDALSIDDNPYRKREEA